MNIDLFLINYPVVRRLLAAGLLLLALGIFSTSTDRWRVQKELTQFGVMAQAAVTDRSRNYLTHDEEDGDIWTYETKYEYTAVGPYGESVTYSGVSANYDTYQKAEGGWIQVIYSSRKPHVALPSGEYTQTGALLGWVITYWDTYLVLLGFLIAALWIDKIDLRKLWIALRQDR